MFLLCSLYRVDLLPYDLITQLFRILSVAYDSRGKVGVITDRIIIQLMTSY